MNLCSDKHDEVCFADGNCPVCSMKDEIVDLNKEIKRLTDDYAGLETEYAKLQDKLDQWESEPIIPAIEKANRA